MSDEFTLAGHRQRAATEQARFDQEWADKVRARQAARPAIAAAARLVLEDARRRGVAHLIEWRDIGLGDKFPCAPPDFEPPIPDICFGSTFRQRR